MVKKFILSISPNYVQDWTEKDGIREFIQNAIDQENAEPDNVAHIKASDGCLIIENNNSILERQTLLLGGGTKQDDDSSIGGFGEGYKIALLVLTRLGFNVHIANYGLGELWEPEISHSHEYNTDTLKICCRELKHGKDIKKGVSVIITKKNYNFKKVLEKIYLKNRTYKVVSASDYYGQVLDSESEKGNIYIGGLFISNFDKLYYGYNFKPNVIKVGRDRNITDTFSVKYNAQYMFENIEEDFIEEFLLNLEDKIEDFYYMSKYSIPKTVKLSIKDKYADKQVISQESDKQILEDNNIKVKNPIVVHSAIKDVIWENTSSGDSPVKKIKKKSIKDLLGEFLEDEKDNLSAEHYEKLKNIQGR